MGAKSIIKRAGGTVVVGLALFMNNACVGPPGLSTLLEVSVNAAMDRRDRQQVFDDGVKQVQLSISLVTFFSLSYLVYNDIAYVIGYVDSAEEKAEVLAKLADGDYGRPETLILIKSESSPSIVDGVKSKAEITGAIVKESDLSYFNINVLTADSTAFVIGEVDKQTQKDSVATVLKDLGFTDIRNFIVVMPRPIRAPTEDPKFETQS